MALQMLRFWLLRQFGQSLEKKKCEKCEMLGKFYMTFYSKMNTLYCSTNVYSV